MNVRVRFVFVNLNQEDESNSKVCIPIIKLFRKREERGLAKSLPVQIHKP